MKGYNLWSYSPYVPPLSKKHDIYVCRIVPYEASIHLEWLGCHGACEIYYKKRADKDFILAGTAEGNEYEICGLDIDTDYEFFVEAGAKRSATRLARVGKSVGTTVNYLHPDDTAYAFSGRYLCSPSLVIHPDGYMLASMDLFALSHPQNLTMIFLSDDGGESWHYVSELMPCFWGKLFIHKGEVYMLSCSTEYGDLLIGKSTDGGKTFTAPVTLLRSSNGKGGNSGVHKNPQNIFIHNGRIYETLEWGAWANKEFGHAAMVMSCDVNDDLLVPQNWSFTEPMPFSCFGEELCGLAPTTMQIEGTLVLSQDGKLMNVLRFGKRGYAICYEVDTENHEAPLRYSHLMEFPANFSKFMIKYDTVSKKYYSVATRLYDGCIDNARNLLSLMVSKDLVSWQNLTDLHDFRDADVNKVGFQYVDFEFEGEDIIYLCRTAINGAHNYHDSNYCTFHRIKNFRNIK